MNNIQILEPGKPLEESEIRQAEEQLRVSFPKEFRDFLKKNNGGRPQPNVFRITGEGKSSTDILDWFLCIMTGDIYDLVSVSEDLRERTPSNLIPIAVDPFGNFLCISVRGNDTGAIYFWDHEKESSQGREPSYDNIYFVAKSFNELLDGLTSGDE